MCSPHKLSWTAVHGHLRHRAEEGRNPLAQVLLALNMKNAVLTSAVVHMCVHMPFSGASDVAITMIQFRCLSADVFLTKGRDVAHSDLYTRETPATEVLYRIKLGYFC